MKMFVKYSAREWDELTGDTGCEAIKVLDGEIVSVYASEKQECPYVVGHYKDGRLGVCGMGVEHEVSWNEAIDILVADY